MTSDINSDDDGGSMVCRKFIVPLLICSGLFLTVGCSSFGKAGRGQPGVHQVVRHLLGFPDDPYLTPIPAAPAEYRSAFDRLEAQDYVAAIEGFSNFLAAQPTTNWTLAAQFNWGRALEGLERHKDALEKYKDVAEKGRRVPKLQGLALLRSGILLEVLGEDDRSLAALKDAEKRAGQMSAEIAQTELPARLASAYARERNFVEADKYFAIADRQLGRLRAQVPNSERPEWLPRILYAMGHRPKTAVQWDHFDSSLIPLERSQIYLLQSAELGIEPWATKSADELISAYGELRRSIDSVPVPAASEMIIAAREQQRLRWERLVKLSDALTKLKTLFVTEIENRVTAESPLKKIVEFADDFEEGLHASLMLDRPVGETGTPDSLLRKEQIRATSIQAKPEFPGEGDGVAPKPGK